MRIYKNASQIFSKERKRKIKIEIEMKPIVTEIGGGASGAGWPGVTSGRYTGGRRGQRRASRVVVVQMGVIVAVARRGRRDG
jgi:hypothetical protein